MNVGILGLGEVGTAVKKLVSARHTSFVREVNYDEIGSRKIHTLHICIPFTHKFVSTVIQAIQEINPQLTIINSTVKPGTTQSIFSQTQSPIVHAPIQGVHPRLYEYFFHFPKFIGPVNELSFRLADKHFRDLGVKTERFDSPLETELAKILSTTYYGWAIIFEKYVYQLCLDQKANFQQVYTRFNQAYNQGYARDLPHVRRPVLKHFDGPIGGHCVIPNAQIIQDWLGDEFTHFILEQNKKLGKSQPTPDKPRPKAKKQSTNSSTA